MWSVEIREAKSVEDRMMWINECGLVIECETGGGQGGGEERKKRETNAATVHSQTLQPGPARTPRPPCGRPETDARAYRTFGRRRAPTDASCSCIRRQRSSLAWRLGNVGFVALALALENVVCSRPNTCKNRSDSGHVSRNSQGPRQKHRWPRRAAGNSGQRARWTTMGSRKDNIFNAK